MIQCGREVSLIPGWPGYGVSVHRSRGECFPPDSEHSVLYLYGDVGGLLTWNFKNRPQLSTVMDTKRFLQIAKLN